MLNTIAPKTWSTPEQFISKAEVAKYNLHTLIKCNGQPTEDAEWSTENEDDSDDDADDGDTVEESAGCFVKKILQEAQMTVLCDKEIACEDFKKQNMCIYSSTHKPDVAIYIAQWIILIIEVISCSRKTAFGNTIRKCILGLVDVIRYYTFFDANVTKFIGFVFPKMRKKNFVTEVTVKYEDFQFVYDTEAVKIDQVYIRLSAAFQHNRKMLTKVMKCKGIIFIPKFYVTLSNECMASFGNDYEQVEANEAIMFFAGDTCYKTPIQKQDSANLKIFCRTLSEPLLAHFINLAKEPAVKGFKYSKVPHRPLSASEARQCLGDLVGQVHVALDLLHSHGLSHMDVRLENICFDENYKAKFIDLDRSCETDECSVTYYSSCMYDPTLNTLKHDWRQLACLILGVVTGVSPELYHSQELENTTHAIKASPFFVELWGGKLFPFSIMVGYHSFYRDVQCQQRTDLG